MVFTDFIKRWSRIGFALDFKKKNPNKIKQINPSEIDTACSKYKITKERFSPEVNKLQGVENHSVAALSGYMGTWIKGWAINGQNMASGICSNEQL